MSKDILPFPLSAFPTAAEISLSLEAGRAQLGQSRRRHLTSTFKKPAWKHGHPWRPELVSFVYSDRTGERAERPETSRCSPWSSVTVTLSVEWRQHAIFLAQYSNEREFAQVDEAT